MKQKTASSNLMISHHDTSKKVSEDQIWHEVKEWYCDIGVQAISGLRSRSGEAVVMVPNSHTN